jgi:glycosyltransferase involved in cell wall biosynthesis
MISPLRARGKKFHGRLGRLLPLYDEAVENSAFLRGRDLTNIVVNRRGSILPDEFPDADIIIGTWWETLEWMRDLPPEKGRPVHFVQGYELFPYIPEDRFNAVMALPIPKITVANWLAERLADAHGVERVRTIHNGIEIADYPAPNWDRPRAHQVGIVHSYDAVKNVDLAIAASKLIPDVPLLGFGIKELKKPDRGHFSPFILQPTQEEIVRIYAACRAWLFTSTEEGFGLPILEAMARGTPVIATRAGAAPDLIDGTNGTLVDARPDAVAAAIRRFISMPDEEWLSYGHAARATAERYRLSDAADRFEAALLAVREGTF